MSRGQTHEEAWRTSPTESCCHASVGPWSICLQLGSCLHTMRFFIFPFCMHAYCLMFLLLPPSAAGTQALHPLTAGYRRDCSSARIALQRNMHFPAADQRALTRIGAISVRALPHLLCLLLFRLTLLPPLTILLLFTQSLSRTRT